MPRKLCVGSSTLKDDLYSHGMPSTTGVDVCLNSSEVQLSLLNLKKAVMLVHKHYNPINWLISFPHQRKHRVVVDGYRTKYVSINRGVPQGTVLALTLITELLKVQCMFVTYRLEVQ